jgi:hypothetical protein
MRAIAATRRTQNDDDQTDQAYGEGRAHPSQEVRAQGRPRSPDPAAAVAVERRTPSAAHGARGPDDRCRNRSRRTAADRQARPGSEAGGHPDDREARQEGHGRRREPEATLMTNPTMTEFPILEQLARGELSQRCPVAGCPTVEAAGYYSTCHEAPTGPGDWYHATSSHAARHGPQSLETPTDGAHVHPIPAVAA